jgi:hypothetical protein
LQKDYERIKVGRGDPTRREFTPIFICFAARSVTAPYNDIRKAEKIEFFNLKLSELNLLYSSFAIKYNFKQRRIIYHDR